MNYWRKKRFLFLHASVDKHIHGAWAMTRVDSCPKMEELGQEFTAHFTSTVLKPQPFMEH